MPRKRPPTDTEQVQALLTWARREKIALHDVTVGSVSVTVVADYNLRPPEAVRPATVPRRSMIEEFAGPLLPAMQGGEAKNEPTEEDED